ncbi:triple specificity protein phosphatase PtpB-like isoform X2 [Mytilus galloprovincialis]|uniref:triple specificity protein phosphatase PtpB-like isoform X2 n=1 Tax=Mytilus galloprovincialis TaxID=29158 RepID=UPI003F7CCD2B
MASANSDRVCIHNWRVLCHGKSKQGNGRHGSIYRSSRPDLMDPLDLEEFKKHGLKLLTDKNNMPAMINCAHGKDRTGILSAMVLSVLGETEENIITDYALSQEGLLPIRDRVFKEVVERYYWDKSFCDANPENMRMLLNYLNKTYGSVKDYLVSIGFSEEEQEILRKNLLEHE